MRVAHVQLRGPRLLGAEPASAGWRAPLPGTPWLSALSFPSRIGFEALDEDRVNPNRDCAHRNGFRSGVAGQDNEVDSRKQNHRILQPKRNVARFVGAGSPL